MTAPDRGYALITGASSGIGAAIARELARRGHALVLTARRAERLEALARELVETHGIAVETIVQDLAAPDAGARLHAETERRALAVEILVNNAGYGVPGSLVSQPWTTHRDFIQVMVSVPVELSWRYLPAMRSRRRGHVINIASLAGHMPGTAGHTLYAAAKAFLIKFSQSLALENARHGVGVTALCPGFTYSEFHDVTGARPLVSRLPKWMWTSAEDVARDGLDAAFRGAVVHVNGRANRMLKFLGKHLPDGLALKLTARRSKDFRVQHD